MASYTTMSLDALKFLCSVINGVVDLPTSVISDTSVATNTTYSSYKIGLDMDNMENEIKSYVDTAIAGLNKLTKEIINDKALVVKDNVLYLYKADDDVSNNYMQMMLINGVAVELGSTQVDLSTVYSKDEADDKFGAKIDLDTLTASFNTHIGDATIHITQDEKDSYVKKTSIATALDDTVTDEQVTSALLTKTELDKVNASLGAVNDSLVDISRMKTYTNVKQLGLESECSTVDIFKAMPNNSLAIIGTFPIVSDGYCKLIDKPISYDGLLTIVKFNYARFSIEYKLSGGTEKFPNRMYVGNFAGSEPTTIDWQELVTMDKISPIPIEANRTITFSNDYTEISVYRCGYSNIRAHIEIDALCNITSVGGWVQDMGIVLPEGYRPSENMSIPAWCSSDTEAHTPITLIIGADGKLSGYIGQSHTSINRLNITVTYFK